MLSSGAVSNGLVIHPQDLELEKGPLSSFPPSLHGVSVSECCDIISGVTCYLTGMLYEKSK